MDERPYTDGRIEVDRRRKTYEVLRTGVFKLRREEGDNEKWERSEEIWMDGRGRRSLRVSETYLKKMTEAALHRFLSPIVIPIYRLHVLRLSTELETDE